MPDTIYLVDTFSLIFQVFHAIRGPMTGADGVPTNAVFGFTRDLKHLLEEIRPTHLVCALESVEPGKRTEIFADYKANRDEMPADLVPQIPLIIELISAYNVPAVQHAGWEADDVIATLACQAAARGMDVRIVSSDKDHRQLLGPRVRMYNIRKMQEFDEAALLAEWGVRPDQVIDFQSLVGDSVDNVPGVPKIGPKTATTLLQQFGTLDEVLAHADEVRGKVVSKNLKDYAEQARMSRELVTLNTKLPLEFDWDLARVGQPDEAKLRELFERLAFRRFAEEIRSRARPTLFAAEDVPREWTTVDTPEKFAKFREELSKQKRICLDLETTGLDAMRAKIVGWAFCWQKGKSWYVPVAGPEGQPHLDRDQIAAELKPLLEDPAREVTNQNLKYDLLVLRQAGIEVATVGMDPMVGDYLLDAGARSHGLDALASKYLNRRLIPITDLIGTGKDQKSMAEVDVAQVAEYASEDADVAWQLAEKITAALKAEENESLYDLYWELERPLIPVLVEMEHNGVRVDVAELHRQSEELTARLCELEAEIHKLAGREFNIGSPKQLAEILFDELGLRIIKRTKTGPSTNQEVLEELALEHDLPALIIEHRQLAKLKGTYLDALPELVHPETGNIHASFNQVVTATGRLSSSDPNLQNIPIRTPEGRRVRKAFVPSRPGWRLVCADYSQIELRLLAHFSDDPALTAAFHEGLDIHTAVAAEIFGVPLEQVDADMRRVAKGVNFGVLYGQSPFGLSAALRISKEEARVFIDSYFDRYPGVERYMEGILAEVQETGFAKTILGRRRRIEGIKNTTGRQRNVSERTAINAVVQGSAADLIKRAMIAIAVRLRESNYPARLLLQIHDELVFEAPADAVDSLVAIVRPEMEQAIALRVPLVVDVKTGENWLDAK